MIRAYINTAQARLFLMVVLVLVLAVSLNPLTASAQSLSEPTITTTGTSVTIDIGRSGVIAVWVASPLPSEVTHCVRGVTETTFTGLTPSTDYVWLTGTSSIDYCGFGLGPSSLTSVMRSAFTGTFSTRAADPVVSASGTPTSVNTGATVTLDGTVTASGGGALTYAWTSSRGGSFTNAAAVDTTWTAPHTAGAATLTLTVAEAGVANTASATVAITVVNRAPSVTITTPAATTVNKGAGRHSWMPRPLTRTVETRSRMRGHQTTAEPLRTMMRWIPRGRHRAHLAAPFLH